MSVKKSVEVLCLKELKFCREEIDNNQMSKIMSKVSKENKIGSSYWQVLGWGGRDCFRLKVRKDLSKHVMWG